jgi:4-hydroxy-tetrahydrodipicolinate synthase
LPATIKAGLEMTGLPVGEPRRPVFGLDAQGREKLKALLDALRQG